MGYLSDPRDIAICGATPMLMAPIFGELPAVEVGQHRFVAAKDGIYVQAKTKALDVCLKISSTPPLPYGELKEHVKLAGGILPFEMFLNVIERASKAYPNEWAGVAIYNPETKSYGLHQPEIESVSAGHIQYKTDAYDDECIAVDIHTHGAGKAYFSSTDDHSDKGGVYVAMVLGNLDKPESFSSCARIVVQGTFYNVPWLPFETTIQGGIA